MTGKQWTTPEQRQLLENELVLYMSMATPREYTRRHFASFFRKWSQTWPERAAVFPDIPLDTPLTVEQEKTLANAITNRRVVSCVTLTLKYVLTFAKQIQQWLRWHAGAGKNRAANRKTLKIVDDLVTGKTRAKHPVEIYSKLYYPSRVKPDMACDSQDSNISGVRDQIKKWFEAESPEIREEVMRIYKEQSRASQKTTFTAEDDEETYPDVDVDTRIRRVNTQSSVRVLINFLFSNIQQCVPALQQILTHLSRKTGWMFSVLMGGLDPTDPDGKCAVAR